LVKFYEADVGVFGEFVFFQGEWVERADKSDFDSVIEDEPLLLWVKVR
jgi:hypothetical protein